MPKYVSVTLVWASFSGGCWRFVWW